MTFPGIQDMKKGDRAAAATLYVTTHWLHKKAKQKTWKLGNRRYTVGVLH